MSPSTRALLAVSFALLLIPTALSSSAIGDDTCTNRFTEPSTGRVDVSPDFAVVTGTAMGFTLMPQGNADAMQWNTVLFHVNGPGGSVDIPASDDNGNAQYKPPKEGHYTVSATWTRYDCGDIGRQTTIGGSAPASTFDVGAGERPRATFATTRRPRRTSAHIPGDASVNVHAACPRDELATHEPIRVDLYWTTNGRPATTRSVRHVWTRGATGCYSEKYTRSKDYLSKSLNASASGDGAAIDVFEPLRADVLIEVHSGDVLVAAKRASFRRSRTGMGVRLRAP